MDDADGMKHTPGPWNVETTEHGSQFTDAKGKYDYGNQAVLVVAKDCAIHPVADTSANHTCRLQEECEANARLIAAAPDLLAALELARSWVALRIYDTHPDLISIDAAIGKAKGSITTK